jgi:hypothetical protein
MTVKMIASEVSKQLRYQISGKEYGRLTKMARRYGNKAVMDAIKNMSQWKFKIPSVMNCLEKECQKCIESGESEVDSIIKGK